MPLQVLRQILLLSLCSLVFLIPIIIVVIVIVMVVKENKEYKNGAYFQITKLPYSSVKNNKGKFGEYLTYKYLKNYEMNGAKFLFNVYIPKENGETSEIDLLMISPKGVFVFEIKNYGGWIFGSETQKNWCQTLPNGRSSHKEHFYNPIMQNRSHIKHLKALLGEQVPMISMIVFSDRCILKNIQVNSYDIGVMNCCNVDYVVSSICNQIQNDYLTEKDIAEIYNKLYPYTQVDEIAKMQHIANIYNNTIINPVHKVDITSAQVVLQNQPESVTEQKGTAIIDADTTGKNNDMPFTEPVKNNVFEQQILKCPNCNGDLILRTAARGVNAGNRFYGCSNYPKCKYIRNIVKETTEKQ